MSQLTSFNISNVGITPVMVYEESVSSTSFLLGCNICNITTGSLPITLYLEKGGIETHILKNVRIEAGENLEVMKGNKLILNSGDKLYAYSNVDDAFDIILSTYNGVEI